jgi:hypothetical protein
MRSKGGVSFAIVIHCYPLSHHCRCLLFCLVAEIIELTKMRLIPSHELSRTQRKLNMYTIWREIAGESGIVRQRYLGPVLLC